MWKEGWRLKVGEKLKVKKFVEEGKGRKKGKALVSYGAGRLADFSGGGLSLESLRIVKVKTSHL